MSKERKEEERYKSVADWDCPNCGTEFERAVDGGPNEYWCPRCSTRGTETSEDPRETEDADADADELEDEHPDDETETEPGVIA